VTSDNAQQVARAVDELRRGQPVTVTGSGGSLTILAVELADADSLAMLDAETRADLLLARPRAALLNIVNQRAAEGSGVVRIARAPWMDLAASVAIADPVRDLDTPFKGPFRATDLGGLADAAAIRLAKDGGLLPAVFAVERPIPGVLAVDAAAVLNYARADSLKLVTRARLPLDGAPDSEVVAFRPLEGGPEHLALIIGPVFAGNRAADAPAPPVLTRLHSACLTGDVLGSLKCDCGPQLRGAVAAIADSGGGVLLYLQQEGRGIGLINKLRAYALQDQGFDTVDANLRLGFESDERDFELAARMLALLGIDRIRLLTNNPDKVAALTARGITVNERVEHKMPPNPHNSAYLATKRDRSGHLL